MPNGRPKASQIASEAKKSWFAYIDRNYSQYPACSFLHYDTSTMPVPAHATKKYRLSVAVVEGNPVDAAIMWRAYNVKRYYERGSIDEKPGVIGVVNTANEKRPGGDWESGLIAPEECFARRSNLVKALATPWRYDNKNIHEYGQSHYPLPPKGGLYSPYVVIFRDGPDEYKLWSHPKVVPVISVAPVRRPRLDESGTRYSFEQERQLMLEKMKSVLRIAAYWRIKDLCLSSFGCGPVFRNPVLEVACMWRNLLFEDVEFRGAFDNVVFAVDNSPIHNVPGSDRLMSEHEVFSCELHANKTYPTTYRWGYTPCKPNEFVL